MLADERPGRQGQALGIGDRKQAAKMESPSVGAAQVTQKSCLPSREGLKGWWQIRKQ